MKTTKDRILNVLNEVTGQEEIDSLDSLDRVDILCALEDEFDVDIGEECLPDSIEGVVKMIDELLIQ